MAKIKKETPKPIEELESVEVHKIDEPIAEPQPTTAPQVIIFSGAKQTVVEMPKIVGESFEERLLNYVGGKSGMQINDFLRLEFKDSLRLQRVNKGIKNQIDTLVKMKKIEVKDNAHLLLGKFFYLDSNPETQYHTVKNTKIEITAL